MGGGHAHCGTLIYLGDSFPKRYRNTAFMCNVHGRRINNDILKPKGSGYTASHGKDFMLSADPWFMGVTLRTGPDGSIYVSDWSDTGECHTYKPDRATGRIYRISYGEPKSKATDLTKLADAELVELLTHHNDYFVRHARRLLQERSRERFGDERARLRLRALAEGKECDDLSRMGGGFPDRPDVALACDVWSRLRWLWALHAIGGTTPEMLAGLLNDRLEHVRAWAIQLLFERETPPERVLAALAHVARRDPSPVVRLYLCSALQRMPLEKRWAIADALARRGEDATDANLPLMLWYGLEPLVPSDPRRALTLALTCEIPLVRQFIARRAFDNALTQGDKGDFAPLVAALTLADAKTQADMLKGAREALRGRKALPMPAGWPDAYKRLPRSDDATFLALLFGDPVALADLKKLIADTATPAAERVRAIEALSEKRVPDLAPLLHAQLDDKATRRAALRGLAAYSHPDTPKKVLAVYAQLTADEKQDAVAALAARKESALALLDAIDSKAVPRADVTAFAARQMFALNDAKLTGRLKAVWGEVRETAADKQKAIAKYKAQLSPASLATANLANGRAVFARNCAQCHKLFGEGGAVGPDLTGSNRSDLDYLLSNLVDPSAEVGRDFRMSVVRTADARVITGIVVERTAARLVVQTATDKQIIAAEDVESVKESALSIMPEGQLDKLSRDEVRDLIGYLAGKAQVPLPK
jgi:putative heme-binding domain-containing protein